MKMDVSIVDEKKQHTKIEIKKKNSNENVIAPKPTSFYQWKISKEKYSFCYLILKMSNVSNGTL